MKFLLTFILTIVSLQAQVTPIPQGQVNHSNAALTVYAGGYPFVWPPYYFNQPGPFVWNVYPTAPVNSVIAARVHGVVGSYFEVYAHDGPGVSTPYWFPNAYGYAAVHLNANNLWNGGQPVWTGTIPPSQFRFNQNSIAWTGSVTNPTYHFSAQAIVYHPANAYGYRLYGKVFIVR